MDEKKWKKLARRCKFSLILEYTQINMIVKEKCIVLNSIHWKDSSKIVTMFSRENGRIKVIARGAFRKNSPFGGLLESLNIIDAVISEKSARSLQILTDAEIQNNFQKLRMMPDHFPYALAILEMINQIFEFSHSEAVFFDFTCTVLLELERSTDPEAVFWYFLIKISSFLGFKPEFTICQSCKDTLSGKNALFSYATGQVICQNCRDFSSGSDVLSSADKDFLIKLQSFPHKRTGDLMRNHPNQNLTPLLIQYLNFHLEKQITLNALSLLT